MGKLTAEVFDESCCDGGAMLNDRSAQPCGCDKGANYTCKRHLMAQQWELEARANVDEEADVNDFKPGQIVPIPPGMSLEEAARGLGLPTDAKARKATPIATGVLDYFPDALAEIARVSFIGNEQHNPGQPLHWDRSKSRDEADALIRHFLERGKTDNDGTRHSAKMAWRALALLQKELEGEKV